MHFSIVQGFSRILLLLLLIAGAASPAIALDFAGNWDYRQTGGEGIETQDEFRQRYSLGFGRTLTYGPTHAISASAALSYTQSRGGGTGRLTGEDELVPSAQFSLVNDIFRTQLGWSSVINRQDSADKNTRSSWSAMLASAWDVPLMPDLRLTYDEGTEFLGTTSFSGEPDRRVKNTGFSLDWDLAVAELFYRFNHSESETSVSDDWSESDSHFARAETSGSLLDGRIGYRFAQQFQTTKRELHLENAEGIVSYILVPGGATASITDPVRLPEPPPGGTWTDEEIADEDTRDPIDKQKSNGDLQDQDVELPALRIDSGDRVHIVFRGLQTGVDLLRLILDSLSADQMDQLAALQWDLYTRNPFGNWELEEENLSVTLDERIIDISIPQFENEIMVVAVNDTGVSLRITEVLGLEVFTGGNKSTTSSYLTNIGLSWRISRSLTATGNMNLDHDEAGNRENDRRGLSGQLRWAPVRFVTPTIAYSEQREEQTGAPESINRTYGLTVPTYPLPTLNVTFGSTYSERYVGELKTDTSNNYSLIFRGPIYPDLTAAWNLNYTESESTDEDGATFEQAIFSSRVDLQARLYANLIADLVTNYRQSDESQGTDATLSLRYRPSDLLALRGAYTTGFGDRSGSDRYEIGMNLRLLVTQKAQMTLVADHRHEKDSSESFALVGSWDINRNLFLRFRGNYTISERSAYGFQVNLGFAL